MKEEPMTIFQALHAVGLNPFAVQLLAESVLRSPIAPMTVGKPQRIAFPVRRSDCAGWAGVQITVEAVPMDAANQEWPTTDWVNSWGGTGAARDVIAERRRQVERERYSTQHDDEHDKGELAQAAACYVLNAQGIPIRCGDLTLWPWDETSWRPKDRRRDLVRAAALLLAEIDRMDRAARAGEAAT